MRDSNTLVIGFDLGGTNIRFGLFKITDNSMKLIKSVKLKLESTTKENVILKIKNIVEVFSSEYGAISVIGGGVAGMIDKKSRCIIKAPNLNWTNFDFIKSFEDSINIKTHIFNDLNSIMSGEFYAHNLEKDSSLLGIFLGTGIGGALINNGKLIEGATGVAGEIGHIKVDFSKSPRKCGCGNYGCIEAYLGGKNFALWMEEIRSEFEDLKGLVSSNKKLHLGIIDELYKNGDKEAIQIMEQVASYLGITLANSVTLFNPEYLLIGGTVWEGSSSLREKSLNYFKKFVNSPAKVIILSPKSVDFSGVSGAAYLAAHIERLI